jgi:hypothetical protein
LIHFLALGPDVPQGTFFQISRLGDLTRLADPSDLIYGFARAPAHVLTDWLFAYPIAYLLAGYAAHVLLGWIIAWLCFLGVRSARPSLSIAASWLLAALLSMLIFPIGRMLGMADLGISLIPHNVYQGFSNRAIFWTFIAISSGVLALNGLKAASWLTAASCFFHPTAGVLAFAVLAVIVAAQSARQRDRRLAAHFLGAALLGATPTIWTLLLSDFPAGVNQSMSTGAWYSSMIKDEADDFSFLYQIIYVPRGLALLFVILGGVLWAFAATFRDSGNKPVYWAAAVPPALFLLGAGVEYAFAVLLPTQAIRPLIALTPGYRLLSFAFFPSVVLAAGVAVHWVGFAWSRFGRIRVALRLGFAQAVLLTASLCVVGVWLAFALPAIRSGVALASLRYACWALGVGRVEGLDAYHLGAARSGAARFHSPEIFRTLGPVVTYPGERNLFTIHALDRGQPRAFLDTQLMAKISAETFADIARKIRASVPPGAGLFVPPYIPYFRDALPRNPIYFQEHYDGNLMLGSPSFLAFWAPRMIELLGFDYEGMPSKHSRLNATAMRKAYLRIDTRKAASLAAHYPAYRYFVTESGHSLSFLPVARNDAFVVYDLRRPIGDMKPPSESGRAH